VVAKVITVANTITVAAYLGVVVAKIQVVVAAYLVKVKVLMASCPLSFIVTALSKPKLGLSTTA
jgi:hypothetical protein